MFLIAAALLIWRGLTGERGWALIGVGAPLLGRALFTFDHAQALEACRLLEPRRVLPVHRDGWTHFREPEAELRASMEGSSFASRTTFLAPGATTELLVD